MTKSVVVHLPMQQGAIYRVGRRTLRSGANVAVLLAPGHDYSVRSMPSTISAIMLDAELLATEIEAGSPAAGGPWALQSLELPLSPEQRTRFRELARQHAQTVSLAQRSRDFDPLVRVERGLASWLAGRLVQSGALKPLSASSRRAAELVAAWIREHAAQSITLEQLAAVAGVSARTLQKACLARWGQTPLELVASRRLELVRSGLAARPSALSVTEAAVRAGFTHLGRFAALYRRVYGQSPSETLAEARHALLEPARR